MSFIREGLIRREEPLSLLVLVHVAIAVAATEETP